jgi:hypothetical protein
LIDEIYGLIEKYMQEYQNLFVIRNIFDNANGNQITLQSYITQILNFWQRKYGIDGVPASFNRVLNKQIKEINNGQSLPTVLIQKDNYLNEQLTNLYMLCKLHFAVDILKQIIAAINATQAQNIVLRGSNHTLPSIIQIQFLITKVQSVIQLPQGTSGRDINSRLAELDAEMTSSTHFKALFYESRDADKTQIRNSYSQLPPANKFSSSNLAGQNIFSYLIATNNNRENIYNDCVVNGVTYVRNQNFVGAVGITGLLTSLSNRVPADRQFVDIQHYFNNAYQNIVPQHIPGLIGLRNNAQPAVQFQNHAGIKLLYANANIVNLQNAITNSPATSYLKTLAPANQNCVDMASLDSAVVVYQEYGFMVSENVFNPITDIAINSPIKTLVNAIPSTHHQNRCPYIDRATLTKILKQIP